MNQVNDATDAVVVIDSSGIITVVNQCFLKVFGFRKQARRGAVLAGTVRILRFLLASGGAADAGGHVPALSAGGHCWKECGHSVPAAPRQAPHNLYRFLHAHGRVADLRRAAAGGGEERARVRTHRSAHRASTRSWQKTKMQSDMAHCFPHQSAALLLNT